MTANRHKAWFEIENGELETMSFCGGTLAHFSQRCPTRVTSPNEDAACFVEVTENHGLIGLADGMGGANAGNRASRAVIESLVNRAINSDPNHQESLRGDILNAIETANQDILGWGIGAASTLAVVEHVAGMVRAFHIGDTKVMLVSNRGRIKFATVGHAPIAMAVEIGMLDEEEAMLHDDLNLVSNCLGSTEMKIELGPPVRMAARDTLVVASDGLFDNLTSEQIAEVIRSGNLTAKTGELARLAIAQMTDKSNPLVTPSKPDDLTILCFRQVTRQAPNTDSNHPESAEPF